MIRTLCAVLVFVLVSIESGWAQDKGDPEEGWRKVPYWEVELYEKASGKVTDRWGPYETKTLAEDGKKRALELTYLGSNKKRWEKAEIVERVELVRDPKPGKSEKQPESVPTLTLPLPGGKSLVVPLSNVDPKPVKGARPPIIELAGKKVKGKLGDSNVTFDFQKGNKLIISGEREGEGEWGLTEDKLTMTTRQSVFLGTVDKDGRMKGKRVNRDGKELLDWSGALVVSEFDQLVGKWNRNDDRDDLYSKFNADGTGEDGTDGGKGGFTSPKVLVRYRWTVEGDNIVRTYEDGEKLKFNIAKFKQTHTKR